MRWIASVIMVALLATGCGAVASDYRWGAQPAAWPAPSEEAPKPSSRPGIGTGIAIGVGVGVLATVLAVVLMVNAAADEVGGVSFPVPPIGSGH